jgi:hypothetical protein
MTKISALSDIGTSVDSNDTFVLVDVSDPTTPNKKIQQQNLFLIPDGSAGTPGLRFLSDTNVGLFRPTTDTLAIATGGSERLRIDSSGRLGLGVSDPVEKLVVAGATANIGIYNTTAGSTASPSYSRLNFYGYLQTTLWNVASISAGNSASNTYGGILQFATNTVGGMHTTALTIDSSQRVGIGTTSPATPLQISSASSGSLGRFSSTASSGDLTLDLGFGNSYFHSLGYELATGNGFLSTNLAGTSIAFRPSGTERARIDSSGRLLVGTSTARLISSAFLGGGGAIAEFQVEGTDLAMGSFASNRNDGYGPYLALVKSRGTAAGSFTLVSNNDGIGALSFNGTDGSAALAGAAISAFVDGTPGTNDMPGRLVFSTTADGASIPTERMRIGSSGFANLFVTATDGFQSRNSAVPGTTIAVFAGRHSATGTTDGTVSYVVWTNGNVENTNNSYGAISDIKLKENIVDANSQWDDLKALQVRNYNFKEGQTHTQIGLVAQEVELVSPGLVSESPDRDAEGNDLGTVTKSVNYSVLYMKAVKALQEAMERIEALEADVAQLKGA